MFLTLTQKMHITHDQQLKIELNNAIVSPLTVNSDIKH